MPATVGDVVSVVTGAALGVAGLVMIVLADSVADIFMFVSPSYVAWVALGACWLFVSVFMVWSPSFVTWLAFVAWLFVVFFAVVMALSVRGRSRLRFVSTHAQCRTALRSAVVSGVMSKRDFSFPDDARNDASVSSLVRARIDPLSESSIASAS